MKSGDKFQMKVKRSLPASGTVSTNWSIVDKNGQLASQRFAQSNGTLVFLPVSTRTLDKVLIKLSYRGEK